MPLTRFPNGLTVNSTTALSYNTAAGDGALDCNNLYVAGRITASTANTMVGERAYLNFSFGATSAATTIYVATPFGGNIIDCWTTSDTTPRTTSLTVQAGSGGTVAVATVSITFATAAGQQIEPTLTPTVITTASAIGVIMAAAGTAFTLSGTIVLQRTA